AGQRFDEAVGQDRPEHLAIERPPGFESHAPGSCKAFESASTTKYCSPKNWFRLTRSRRRGLNLASGYGLNEGRPPYGRYGNMEQDIRLGRPRKQESRRRRPARRAC